MTSVKALRAHTDEKQRSSYSLVPPAPASSLPEQLRFFFKPLQFHLELTDLPIQFILQLVPVLIRTLAAVRKKIREHLQKTTTPLTDLIGIDAELTRNLSNGLFPFDCFQSDFGLKSCVMLSAHVDHFTIPPFGLWQVKMHLIHLSSFWGVFQYMACQIFL